MAGFQAVLSLLSVYALSLRPPALARESRKLLWVLWLWLLNRLCFLSILEFRQLLLKIFVIRGQSKCLLLSRDGKIDAAVDELGFGQRVDDIDIGRRSGNGTVGVFESLRRIA
jgi:hypothetical protein